MAAGTSGPTNTSARSFQKACSTCLPSIRVSTTEESRAAPAISIERPTDLPAPGSPPQRGTSHNNDRQDAGQDRSPLEEADAQADGLDHRRPRHDPAPPSLPPRPRLALQVTQLPPARPCPPEGHH